MKKLISIFILLFLLCSCYYSPPNQVGHWVPSDQQSIDSVTFRISHHYWKGFIAFATDSFHLMKTLPPNMQEATGDFGYTINPNNEVDTISLHKGDQLIVLDISKTTQTGADSILIKVARDQLTQGWISEQAFLNKIVPNDPISRFIHFFSDTRSLILFPLLGLSLLVFTILLCLKYNKVKRQAEEKDWKYAIRRQKEAFADISFIPSYSLYALFFCFIVAISSALYGGIQHFAPDTWIEFYFHPTINPLSSYLPPIMHLFLGSVWLLLISGIAVMIDLSKTDDGQQIIKHLASLIFSTILIYFGLTEILPLYLGHIMLVLIFGFRLKNYFKRHTKQLICGNCGQVIENLGVCPNCGAIND
ncbi:MAG: hypothetical protein HXK22_02675 [Alloprevotella tannerae]|nr:hypothetical protein [Alloprevotella tannerae]